jgi:hypothetical protein
VLWPSTQWYYSTLAVPALTPVAAALMAVQVPGLTTIAAVAVAIEVGARSWPALRASWWPPTATTVRTPIEAAPPGP